MPVNIIIDSKFDDRGVKNAQKQLQNMAGQAAKRVAQVGAAVAAAGAVAAGKLAVDAVRAASDFEESVNAVNVAFGEAAQGVLDIGENAASSMGLSQNEFNQAATRFSAFAETVVGEGGNVAGFIGDVSQRAADFASVFNIEVSEALQVFQSGLAGEAEPLKRFGINLLQSEVAAFAMANGIAESASQMTEAEKVQARYGLLLESTAKTQGDFTNTSDSLANSQRILRAELENLQIEIGSALIPVAKDLVNTFANALLPRLEDFGQWINSPEGTASVTEFGEGLVELFEAALDFGGWILDNLTLLKNLGIAIAGITASVYAYQVATLLATVATNGFTASLLKNPFGAVAVALTLLATGAVMAATSLGDFGEEETTASEKAEDFRTKIQAQHEELQILNSELESGAISQREYDRRVEFLTAKLEELRIKLARTYEFTEAQTEASYRARDAAIANRFANENLKPALENTGTGYNDLAFAATNAKLGIESVTIAEEAQRLMEEQSKLPDHLHTYKSYEQILAEVAAKTRFQTEEQVAFNETIRQTAIDLGLVVPETLGAAGASRVLTNENEKLAGSFVTVTKEIDAATRAANQFRQATPGSPGPGGLFEVVTPDGGTALATIEGGIQEGLRVAGSTPEPPNLEGLPKEEQDFIMKNLFPEVELALGGVITKPTRALIGEGGPEAVIPMSKLDRMMRGNNRAGGNTFIINVQSSSRIGGAQAGEEVVNALKTYNTNNGDFNRALTGFGA